MSVAITRTNKRPERPTLSPEKGNELLGLALMCVSLLLAFSFATYHPADPSLFHDVPQATARSHNWIGSAGAQAAAVGFGFFGLSCFLLPVFLLVAGWRRLRWRSAERVVGRGFGSAILLAALPGLCQLLVGNMAWRGERLAAGGAFGSVVTGLLDEKLNFTGSLLVLASAVVLGTALVVQSTLGQVLSAWRARLRQAWQDHTLARERRQERREKERARRRVITKHLQRVVEEKQEKQRREDQGAGGAKGAGGRPAEAVRGASPAAAAFAGDSPTDRRQGRTAGGSSSSGSAMSPMSPMAPLSPTSPMSTGRLAYDDLHQATDGDDSAFAGSRLDLPLRVAMRRGTAEFALRRVAGSSQSAAAEWEGNDENEENDENAGEAPPPAPANRLSAAAAPTSAGGSPRPPLPPPGPSIGSLVVRRPGHGAAYQPAAGAGAGVADSSPAARTAPALAGYAALAAPSATAAWTATTAAGAAGAAGTALAAAAGAGTLGATGAAARAGSTVASAGSAGAPGVGARAGGAMAAAAAAASSQGFNRPASSPPAPSPGGSGSFGGGPAGPGAGFGAGQAVRPRPEPRQQEMPFDPSALGGGLPPVNLLQLGDGKTAMDETELVRLGDTIRSRCAEFGVEGTIEAISPGPVITVYEFQPAPGVKVSHIVNLQDDLALALKAESVRIERMPGRSTLGLEVPNRERGVIRLGSLLADERFRKAPSVLTMALGTTIYGEPYYADLATMPHLLVAGATGAGKSVGLQSMITSILYRATRDEVQFIFIDPKRIELGVYADIPHLKCEVVVDPKKAANALRWAVAEMERRYRLLAEVHVRSIGYYNRAICDPEVRERLALTEEGEASPFTAADLKPLPYYVVIIDELADLMMVSSSEVETSIARLAQMARAVGIHLIVATQRPSVDVLTGTIKANFPCRISYATASRHDSRTILDQVGSEKLLGKGDMLMMPPGSSRVIRLHGAYVSEQETASLVRWLKKQGKPNLDPDVLRPPAESEHGGSDGGDNDDELYDEAARLVVAERQASASFLQRRMRIGFSRAARLIDIMERDGLLGPPQGSKPREVLVKPNYFTEVDVERGEDYEDG